jgi:hypothetical protein
LTSKNCHPGLATPRLGSGNHWAAMFDRTGLVTIVMPDACDYWIRAFAGMTNREIACGIAFSLCVSGY